MARIVVSGYMVRHPVAGNVLAYLHYVLGLRRLGHEVAYVEESGWSGSCFDPRTGDYGDDPTAGLAVVRGALGEQASSVPVFFVASEGRVVHGGTLDSLRATLAAADVLLHVGGVNWLPEFARCRRRVLIDMDPLFTQADRFGGALLERHEVHFSYGTNLGAPDCGVPTRGIDWIPTLPPVVRDLWPRQPVDPASRPFTTIANWGAYGSTTVGGVRYGQKDVEFLGVLELPRRTGGRFELALSGVDATTTSRLRAAGWSVRSGDEVSRDLATYRDHVRGSKGEFSVAKQAYVATRSGWFSDRTACYLAAALPAIVQDTGVRGVPTGVGLLTFSDLDGAVAAVRAVDHEYDRHRQAADDIASSVLDHRPVLTRLVERSLAAPARRQAAAS